MLGPAAIVHHANSSLIVWFCCHAVETPELAPTTSSSSTFLDPASKYAVLDLNGFRQVVEEGGAYTCSKDALQQLPSPGSRLQFHNIMALRDGGRFVTGKPYLTGALVEAELVEEFAGPVPSLTAADAAAAALPPLSPVMAKYRVTRILGSSSSGNQAAL
jgi:ribosomal protein L21